MYEFLKPTYTGSNKQFIIPNAGFTKAMVGREVIKISQYYSSKPNKVNPDHFLVRLLEQYAISGQRTHFGVVQAVLDRTPEIAKQFKLVHPENSSPELKTGNFFNKRTQELIIIHETTIHDGNKVKNDWRNLHAIRFLYHPFNDLDLCLCNGEYPYTNDKYASIIIDVQLLLLQYHYWRKEVLSKNRPDVSFELFVGQFVIPSMVSPCNEICLINRAIALYNKESVPSFKRQHPIGNLDVSMSIDKFLQSQVDIMNTQVIDIHDFFGVVPSLTNDTWKDSLAIPNTVPNGNMRWALEASVVPYILFMVSYYEQNNKHELLSSIAGKLLRDVDRLSKHDISRQGFTYIMQSTLTNLENRLKRKNIIR